MWELLGGREHLSGDRDRDDVLVTFEGHGALDESPECYELTLESGNLTARYVVSVAGEQPELLNASVALVGVPLAAPAGAALSETALLVGGALVVVALPAAVAWDAYQSTQMETEMHSAPASAASAGTVGSWTLPEHGVEITLPSGTVHRGPNGEVVRGAGLEYVEATGLTQADVEHAMIHRTNVVVEDGEVRAIIGRGTDSTEKVILSIIGGTIVAASPSTAYNEDCGATVRMDKGDNPEHSLRDGKPLDEVTALKEVLESATIVVDTGSKRYYLHKIGNKVIMASTNLVDDTYQVLKTLLTGEGPDNSYGTYEKALNDINGDYEVVHDERNGIDC